MALAKSFGEFYGYLSASFSYFGTENVEGIDLRPKQLAALGAVEWRIAPAMSLVVQYLLSQGVAENLGTFSQASHEITVGWKGEVLDRGVLEIGIIENLFNYTNSPDIGVHAGLTYRF